MAGLRQDESPPRTRRWGLIRPPGRHPDAPFDGLRVLPEMGGELGLTLFQRCRDVALWAATPPERRARLFAAGRRNRARVPPVAPDGLAEPLALLSRLVARPESASVGEAARACTAIADWAASRALLGIAADFAEVAAQVMPHDPLLAVEAGRIARKRAEYERAILWFQRAIALSRRFNRHSAYVVALISWATLELQRGNLVEAKALLGRGWRKARRHKLQHLKGRTRHDLLQVCIDTGEYDEADQHAAEAFRFYGPRARNILALAHDWTVVWSRKEHFLSALPVLEVLVPHIHDVHLRVLLLSSIALCAGVLGDESAYDHAAADVTRTAAGAAENVAWSFINVGEGARSLGRVEEARDHGTRGLDFARARRETVAEEAALALLERSIPTLRACVTASLHLEATRPIWWPR